MCIIYFVTVCIIYFVIVCIILMRLLSYNCDDVICSGCARPVPASVIELVKAANRSLKLGQLLCQCRSPDFLLEVIEKQVQCVCLS